MRKSPRAREISGVANPGATIPSAPWEGMVGADWEFIHDSFGFTNEVGYMKKNIVNPVKAIRAFCL